MSDFHFCRQGSLPRSTTEQRRGSSLYLEGSEPFLHFATILLRRQRLQQGKLQDRLLRTSSCYLVRTKEAPLVLVRLGSDLTAKPPEGVGHSKLVAHVHHSLPNRRISRATTANNYLRDNGARQHAKHRSVIFSCCNDIPDASQR